MEELKGIVLKYLDAKGMIKACLLHKLINYFCTPNSKFIIKKLNLLSCLVSLVKERKIDIIIIKPYDIKWKITKINNSTYLEDGEYFIRTCHEWNYKNLDYFEKSKYLFDSRKLDYENIFELEKTFEWLLEIFKKKKKIKYTTLIYLQDNSNELNIYEALNVPFKVRFNEISPPINLISQDSKFNFDLEKQITNLSIIKAFRTKYMCFYITLIEAIHHRIIKLQKMDKNCMSYPNKQIQEYIKKFGYYCINFVKSDWVDLKKSNPYRWETFFQLFNLPFKILNLEFKTIRFHGRTFEILGRYKFCIIINNSYENVILHLKKKGYKEFRDINEENFIAIGLEQEIYLPCPSIEHFYFIIKYICYFQLFLLFYHSFDYIKNFNPNIRLTSKEKMLFEVFFPVMNELFNVSKESISKLLVFKYYNLNPDELEVIYNNIMVSKIKHIETKMFKYFLMKHSICTNFVNN